jgi:hypothetical protein
VEAVEDVAAAATVDCAVPETVAPAAGFVAADVAALVLPAVTEDWGVAVALFRARRDYRLPQ